MTRTVIALFRDSNEAQVALRDLEAAGFTRDHLNLVAYDGSGKAATGADSDLSGNTAKGAAAGGVAGLLLGLAALAIPGIGPIVAAGPIAVALAGAGVGAAAGGMLGALTDMGVPGEEAAYYEEAIRRGGTLLIVRADEEMAERAQSIVDRHGALDLEESAATWKASGWSPDNAHSDAGNFGDEGGSSQWSKTVLTSSGEKACSRVYADKRK